MLEQDRNTRPRRGALRRLRLLARRPLPLFWEMVFLALVIGAWQLARIPFQGSLPLALAHARDWLALEQALHLDVEATAIRAAHHLDAVGLLHWGYYNLHLPVLFGFMALARQLRPDRYPLLRSAFVLSHVPALLVIALYPLAPPRWVAGMPFAVIPPDDLNGSLHNATAAAASQHVGYPLFIAIGTVLLAPRSRLAWLAFAYPALVFAIVLGTSNHYTLDAFVGGLCVAVGFGEARVLLGGTRTRVAATAARGTALLTAAGYACIVNAISSAGDLSFSPDHVTTTDVVLAAGVGMVLAGWRRSRVERPRTASKPSFEGSRA